MEFLSEDKLAALAKGTEIELPGFVEGETISVRLRRPSLMLMAAEGKIPNPLSASVEDLFEHGEKNKVSLKERGEIFRVSDGFTGRAFLGGLAKCGRMPDRFAAVDHLQLFPDGGRYAAPIS